jgi:membrane-anchored protein YejM (alkaline phosphatase superfamily)
MDQTMLGQLGHADQVESAISNYELAFRMQSSVPELGDISKESKSTKKMYGLESDDPHCRNYGTQCLLARRLVERGVRFIELTIPNTGHDRWDQHSNLKKGHEDNAHAVDQPVAGLLKDLKQRGLLEETLVVFASEFGRTPFAQGINGRDHNPSAFSIWMAGGGVKGGTVYGKTDEYGYRVIENKTSIHDMHATMLHLLGVDHVQQTYRFSGRDIRLTDVHGHVLHDILA